MAANEGNQGMGAAHDPRRLKATPPQRGFAEPATRFVNPNLRVLPLLILIYSFLLFPVEVRFSAAGLNIYAFRIAILIALPLLIYLSPRRTGSFSGIDLMIGFGCGWMLVSFASLYGPQVGLVRSAAIVLDTFGAYLIARGSVSSLDDLRRVLILIIPGLIFSSAFFVVESISGRHLIRPLFASIFGSAVNYEGGVATGSLNLIYEKRLGLLRAYSVFSYPILGGTILASLLPLYLMSGLRSRALYAGVITTALAFFSVSSAAIIALVLGVGLLITDRLLPYVRPFRWPLISVVLAFYAVLAEIALQGGIVGVLSRITLNPATAYIRRMQWKYGGESVAEHPLIGIGFANYVKPDWLTDAIDAHFLALAMRFGLITPVLFGLAILIVVWGLGRAAPRLPKADRDLLVGINFMLVILIFSSMTVTFFSEANVFFMIVVGIATSCLVATRSQPFRPMAMDFRPGQRFAGPANSVPTSSQMQNRR